MSAFDHRLATAEEALQVLQGTSAEIHALELRLQRLEAAGSRPHGPETPARAQAILSPARPEKHDVPVKQSRRSVAASPSNAASVCRLAGATDGSQGSGAEAKAWIAKDGGDVRVSPYGVSDIAPCVGNITRIYDDGHGWVVQGTTGTLRE